MADLFDIKVGGAGWHVTSHLIALVALFVACFAITGYITFRDDSVPDSALKGDADTLDHIQAVVSPGLLNNSAVNVAVGTLPANAVVTDVIIRTDALTVSAGATLTYTVGTAAATGLLVTTDTIMNTGTLTAGDFDAVGTSFLAVLVDGTAGSNAARDIVIRFTETASAAITTAGSYTVRINYSLL